MQTNKKKERKKKIKEMKRSDGQVSIFQGVVVDLNYFSDVQVKNMIPCFHERSHPSTTDILASYIQLLISITYTPKLNFTVVCQFFKFLNETTEK